MSTSIFKSVLLFGLCAIGVFIGRTAWAQEAVQTDPSRLDQSRAIVKSFGGQLQTELVTAIKEGGAVNAIDVCKLRAPQIAKKLSDDTGATVGRTSLKTRNPKNTPSVWQQQILNSYENRQRQNATLKEHYEELSSGEIRYMQAITVKPLCLACHGKSLGPDIQIALNQLYPSDRAVGYDLSEVRGAFSISWPPTALATQNASTSTSTQPENKDNDVTPKELTKVTVLSKPEIQALNDALDDEYKSLATYEQVISDFGAVRPFTNISKAEARHIGALKRLFSAYGVTPATNPYLGKVPR